MAIKRKVLQLGLVAALRTFGATVEGYHVEDADPIHMGADIKRVGVNRRPPRRKKKMPVRRKDPPRYANAHKLNIMPYRRKYRKRRYTRRGRRVRRRRRAVSTLAAGRPAKFHRMKHRLDSWMYLSAAEYAFAGHHTQPYQIFHNEQVFDIKLNDMHDPYSFANIAGTNTGSTTSVVPLFYNTMKSLYKTYKVNNVYVQLTFTNNRPIGTDSATTIAFDSGGAGATTTRVTKNDGEVPAPLFSQPVIIGAFPVAGSTDAETAAASNDSNWAYRPGAKSYLLHSQQSRTVTFKLNPANVIGLSNSWSSEAYYPSAADTAPTELSNLRVTWCPPVTDNTANDSDRAVSVFCRTWWDVTWAHPLNEGDSSRPGAT